MDKIKPKKKMAMGKMMKGGVAEAARKVRKNKK